MAMAALSASASPPFFHIGSSSYRNRRIDRKFRSIFFGALRIAKVENASRRRQEFGLLVTAHLGQGDDIDLALDFLAQAPDNVQNIITRAEGWLYTVADAAITADTVTDGATDAATTSKDWLSGVTYIMETVLKLLNDGLTTLKIPYAYGFSIILLTVLVKAATFPLTKSQVESTISMQNLQPKIKAIQARYGGDQQRIQMETARLYKQAGVNPLAGCLPTLATLPVWIGLYRALSNVANEGLLTEGFFWIPSLAGPTSIAARQGGSGTSWLFPFVDGHPPLGWSEALAYLVLPLLLIGSQYVSMQLMQPPQTDPSQKTTNAVLKFLPLMIGYFALSVPSGLSLYWLTSNILSTGQQVWLKKLGGAKPAVAADGGNIISAGQAKRSSSSSSSSSSSLSSSSSSSSSMATLPSPKESRRGERFKQLKAAEMSRKKAARESSEEDDEGDGEGEGEGDGEGGEGEGNEGLKDSLEEMYANSGNGAATRNSLNKSKRSKRKRSV